ncbi:hypothetical protein TNCV_4556501 [Trichonephila clavipes]|nr:hypothetical protein TNCV_4556501 [Trichonephila clavipes]
MNVNVTGQFIAPPYGTRSKATELISVASAFCLQEQMELGRRRGRLCADLLCSPIRDDWGVKEAHKGVQSRLEN